MEPQDCYSVEAVGLHSGLLGFHCTEWRHCIEKWCSRVQLACAELFLAALVALVVLMALVRNRVAAAAVYDFVL